MEARRVYLILMAGVMLTCVIAGGCWAARTVKGTVVSASSGSVVVKPDGGSQNVTLKPAPDASITRGQMGKSARKAKVAEFGEGDRVVATVSAAGPATALKAFYSISKGTICSIQNGKVFYRDGRSIKLRPGMSVVFDGGRVGKASDLKPGCQLICRVNPLTSQAFTVVAKMPKKPSSARVTSVAPVVPKLPQAGAAAREGEAPSEPPVKPVIKSVTYKGPDQPRAKDWLRVDVTGTPGGRVVCQVKGLIPRTEMKEIEPGSYRAQVMVPSGKSARNEPLVAYLTLAGADASPVQASKLFTVECTEPTKLPPLAFAPVPPHPEPAEGRQTEPDKPVEAPAPETQALTPPEPAAPIEPAKPEPVVQAPEPEPVKPEPPKVKPPVVLASPAVGARIQRVISVAGTADPGANVMVTVSYSNGLGGILHLSGQVSSQLVAVSPTGEFHMGPIALEGPLATKGLVFTVRAAYPESMDQTVEVKAFGDRD